MCETMVQSHIYSQLNLRANLIQKVLQVLQKALTSTYK